MAIRLKILQFPIRLMSTESASSKLFIRNLKIHELEQGPSRDLPRGILWKRNDGIIRCMSTQTSIKLPNSDDKIQDKPDDLYKFLWVKCTAHQTSVLDSYEKFVKLASGHLGISYVKTEEPHRVIRRRTLLASRHVHKKYRVQYEVRTYYRHLLFKNLTGSTADTFLEYIERSLPEGMFLIAEKHKIGELPFDLEQK